VPVALRLFLPDDWIKQPDRCRDAGVPEWGKNDHRRQSSTPTDATCRSAGHFLTNPLDRSGSMSLLSLLAHPAQA
jgi:hypothetical protein